MVHFYGFHVGQIYQSHGFPMGKEPICVSIAQATYLQEVVLHRSSYPHLLTSYPHHLGNMEDVSVGVLM